MKSVYMCAVLVTKYVLLLLNVYTSIEYRLGYSYQAPFLKYHTKQSIKKPNKRCEILLLRLRNVGATG